MSQSYLPDLPVTYTDSPARQLRFAAFMLVLSVGMFFMVRDTNPVFVWVFLAFGVFIAICSVLASSPRRSFLELTPEGMRISSLFRKQFVAWKDIQAFTTVEMRRNQIVAWYYTDEFKRQHPGARRSGAIDGEDDRLPSAYGHLPDRLALQLNELRVLNGGPGMR